MKLRGGCADYSCTLRPNSLPLRWLLHGRGNKHPEPFQMFMLMVLLQVLWLQDEVLLGLWTEAATHEHRMPRLSRRRPRSAPKSGRSKGTCLVRSASGTTGMALAIAMWPGERASAPEWRWCAPCSSVCAPCACSSWCKMQCCWLCAEVLPKNEFH